MKAIILISLSIMLLLALSLSASALAVASDYLEDNTLTLIEDSSKIYSIRLQNPDSYEARFKVDYDKQFMNSIDFKEEYVLQPQSTARIEFNVTSPKYDEKNNLFVISYTIHQLSSGSGGTFFLTKISKNFKLKVEKKTDENPGKSDAGYDHKSYVNYKYAAYAVVALAFMLYVFRKKLLKNNKAKAKKISIKNRKIIK